MSMEHSDPTPKGPDDHSLNTALLRDGETMVKLIDAESLPTAPTQGQLAGWIRRGLTTNTGDRQVFLEWMKVGPHKCTSVEAFIRFQDAKNK